MLRADTSEVVRFEIIRTLKRVSFWVAALLLPMIIVGYVTVVSMIGSGADDALGERATLAGMRLGVWDEAGRIEPELLREQGVTVLVSEAAGRRAVADGVLDVAYIIPENLEVRIYFESSGVDFLTDYRARVDEWLHASTLAGLTPDQQMILTQAYEVESINLTDVNVHRAMGDLIAPLMGLVVFYALICIFGNRLTASTIEEKENRISEMLLTACSARSLIVGKMIALILLGFLQVAILAVPVLLAFMLLQDNPLEGVLGALGGVEFGLGTVFASLVLLLLSYILFTGLSMFIGTLVPTAKEVGAYSGIVMIGVILPIFFIGEYLATEPSALANFLTFFPLSAPISLFARLALGTIPLWQFWLATGVVALFAVIFIFLTIRTFQLGLMEFSRKLQFKEIIGGKQ
ncbi:ABC transporter permease [Candidatus Saccharibacteria bacterium]|nr:ABC transporter permease [Candidatus Saccharibacteria bacterium]